MYPDGAISKIKCAYRASTTAWAGKASSKPIDIRSHDGGGVRPIAAETPVCKFEDAQWGGVSIIGEASKELCIWRFGETEAL
jgi:hypothetical protein